MKKAALSDLKARPYSDNVNNIYKRISINNHMKINKQEKVRKCYAPAHTFAYTTEKMHKYEIVIFPQKKKKKKNRISQTTNLIVITADMPPCSVSCMRTVNPLYHLFLSGVREQKKVTVHTMEYGLSKGAIGWHQMLERGICTQQHAPRERK